MTYIEQARKLRPLVVKAAQSLDDKDASEAVALFDGMRYDGGIPFIWNEDSDADCFDECNTFAVYWRPVEEEGK